MLSNKWGWYTQQNSKPRLWQMAKKFLKDRCWIIYERELYEELKTFQKESPEDRGASAEEGMHDDLVIASMIALYTSHDMDVGDVTETAKPLSVKGGNSDEVIGAWTAVCTRCSQPPWQVDNPQYAVCPNPKCRCRIIKAFPNHEPKPVVTVDFNELGRDPTVVDDNPRTSFEYF